MLFLRKSGEVNDYEFEQIEPEIRDFMRLMLGKPAERPSANDVY